MPFVSNLLLDSLSAADAAALKPYLKPIHLDHKRILVEAGGTIDAVYFPTGAVVSLVIGLSTGTMVEGAMVGRDGVVGGASALDGRISLSRAIVQLEGWPGREMLCHTDFLPLEKSTFAGCFVISMRDDLK